VFRIILGVNNDYFLEQDQPVDLCNDEVLITSAFIKEQIKMPPSLSKALIAHHHKAFTLILSISEGQAGIAWEPYDIYSFYSPHRYKASLACPQNFLFASSLLLSLQTLFFFSFKGLLYTPHGFPTKHNITTVRTSE
jgi:hypothetical protein